MAEIYINGAQSTDYHPHPALHGFSHMRQKAAGGGAEDGGFEFRYFCPLVAKSPLLVSLSSDIFL